VKYQQSFQVFLRALLGIKTNYIERTLLFQRERMPSGSLRHFSDEFSGRHMRSHFAILRRVGRQAAKQISPDQRLAGLTAFTLQAASPCSESSALSTLRTPKPLVRLSLSEAGSREGGSSVQMKNREARHATALLSKSVLAGRFEGIAKPGMRRHL
jgi:hypothetical protein